MLSMRTWQHERIVEAAEEGGCTVTDRLTFEPRVPGFGRLSRAVIGFLFRHRHDRLERRFGTA